MNQKIVWADRIRQRTAGAGADMMVLGKYIESDIEMGALRRLLQHLREIDNVANEIASEGQKEFMRTTQGQEYIDEFERTARDIERQQRERE